MTVEQYRYPDLVPARMVNEFVYCPRLAYLEWVQGEFAVNADVAEGRYQHRATDKESGELPEDVADGEKIHARSVWLSAPEEWISARIDLVEGNEELVVPVDYKRGNVPDIPERAWPPDRIQLCAQGLVLNANGYQCRRGIVYYCSSKTRVDVEFTDDLKTATRQAVAGIRAMAQKGDVPLPLQDSPKCPRCSMAGICLPDEVNMLKSDAISKEDGIRRIMPARDDSLPLYVQEQGARIIKNDQAFSVQKQRKKLGEARIFETSQISLFGNVQLTTQVFQEACSRGIPLTFFSSGGWFYGMAHGMSHKNVELRQAQFRISEDKTACLGLAKTIIAAKIANCRTLLMRNHVDIPEDTVKELKRIFVSSGKAKSMDQLLGFEGLAARTYFSKFAGMLKVADFQFDFNGRNRRPPVDAVNALLSFAYSLLVKDLAVTVLTVGFDPMLGFYHQPRYGRPALALDLMEEFRPLIADSVVIWVVNNGVVGPADFIRRGNAVALKGEARKKYLHAYERRLDSLIIHPVFGYRISYRRVLEVQARLLGRFLLGEIGDYPPFRTR